MRSGPPRRGDAWGRIVDGFYLYYDVPLPFRAEGHPLMHGIVLLAVMGFTLAISLAVAERRALLATGLLVAGAAWPATLLTSSNTVGRGAVILGAALVLLGGLSSAARLRQGSVAAAVVIVAAVLVSGMPAVAKGAFLGWETWEPSRKNDLPISVGYVWDSNYAALVWPERKTTVLTIEAPPISRYWRATTLDVFNGDYWLESTLEVQPDPLFDPLMPPAGRNEQQQLEARVKVEALQDNRLIGASVPVRYELDDEDEFVLYQSTGTAYVPQRRAARLDLHVVELRAAAGGARSRALRADLLLRARPLPRRAVANVDAALAALRHARAAPGDGPDLRREPGATRVSAALRARARDRGGRAEPVRSRGRSSRPRSATVRATCTTRTRRRAGTCRRSSSS